MLGIDTARHPYFQGFGLFVFPGPPYDRWAVGWMTGRDGDSICARPNLADGTDEDRCLSPCCETALAALVGFVLKFILLGMDRNINLDPEG